MSYEQRFSHYLDTFLMLLPSVRDGEVEAIHDARVATRRLRSMVRLFKALAPDVETQPAHQALKDAGRVLGNARDVDVALELAAEIETRAPVFALPLAALRTTLVREQLRRRRKMVKRLDALQFEPLFALHRHARTASRPAEMERVVAAAIAEHSELVARAVDHASGVYFTNRAHGTRIALKKLRHLVELADGCEAQCKALKLLRRSQEALGQIHDREVLRAHLKQMDWDSEAARATSTALAEVLEAEIRTFYQKFLTRRSELAALLRALHDWATVLRTSRRRRRMLTAAVAAVPSAAMVMLARRIRT
jgi:CHAD domain-containing protein